MSDFSEGSGAGGNKMQLIGSCIACIGSLVSLVMLLLFGYEMYAKSRQPTPVPTYAPISPEILNFINGLVQGTSAPAPTPPPKK